MIYNSSPDKKGSNDLGSNGSCIPTKGRATAKKIDGGWDIQFEQGFLDEMAVMSPEDKKIFEEILNGLKNGSIDPFTLGKNLCGYCGKETTRDSNICKECIEELR